MINKIKEKKDYILAFFISFILFLLVLFLLGFVIRNDYIFLKSDLEGQYIALLSHLRRFIYSEASMFYSFEKGIGGAMFGTYIYYLMSPINFIVAFFKTEDIYQAVVWIISIKVGLSGLTMYTYLKNSFKDISKYALYLFALAYAFCAYNISYSFNIMWLDTVYLLPLVILGLDNLINKNKKILYFLSLFAVFIVNYYIGYMVSIFTIIYMLFNLYLSKENVKKKMSYSISYFITSFFAGMTAMIALLPMYKELRLGSKLSNNVFSLVDFNFNFNIFDFFSRFYLASDTQTEVLNNHSILLYTGVFIIPMTILFFLNKKINKKEKIASGTIIILFVLSFLVNYINFIWHGMNAPLSFNARYSFMISFILIILSLKSLINSKYLTKNNYFLTGSIIIIFSALMMVFSYHSLNIYIIYGTIALSMLYLVFLYYYNDPSYIYKRKLIVILVSFLVIAELFSNAYLSFQDHNFFESNQYEKRNKIINEYISEINIKDKSFYRLEKINFDVSVNDGLIFDYSGIDNFLSTNNENALNFFINNGYSYGQNSTFYQNPNIFVDSILNVKYMITRNFILEDYVEVSKKPYSLYDREFYGLINVDTILYENPYSIGFIYAANADVLQYHDRFWKLDLVSKPELTNLIAQTLTGFNGNVLNKLNVNKIDDYNYEFTAMTSDPIYIYPSLYIKELSERTLFYINGVQYGELSGMYNGAILIDGFEKGDKITFSLDKNANLRLINSIDASYLDLQMLKRYTDYLKENTMNILKMGDTYVKGEIELTEEKPILFTSIPYEPGWTVKVDGVKKDYEKVYDSFIGINIGAGKHIVEFSYETPMLKEGIIISIISLILFVLYYKKGDKIQNIVIDYILKYKEIILYLIVGFATTVVSIGSYYVLTKLLLINYLISSFVSWIFAVSFAYFANKVYVFKSKKNNIIKEIIKFFEYRVLSLLVDLILMYTMVSIFNIDDLLSKVVIQIIIVVLNYYFSKLIIFKEKD